MAWNVGAFGANAWNYGEVTVPVTSTSAIGTTALGNETVVEGTGVTFGVTSTSAIASHTVERGRYLVSLIQGLSQLGMLEKNWFGSRSQQIQWMRLHGKT